VIDTNESGPPLGPSRPFWVGKWNSTCNINSDCAANVCTADCLSYYLFFYCPISTIETRESVHRLPVLGLWSHVSKSRLCKEQNFAEKPTCPLSRIENSNLWGASKCGAVKHCLIMAARIRGFADIRVSPGVAALTFCLEIMFMLRAGICASS